jgi:hypothetical protein
MSSISKIHAFFGDVTVIGLGEFLKLIFVHELEIGAQEIKEVEVRFHGALPPGTVFERLDVGEIDSSVFPTFAQMRLQEFMVREFGKLIEVTDKKYSDLIEAAEEEGHEAVVNYQQPTHLVGIPNGGFVLTNPEYWTLYRAGARAALVYTRKPPRTFKIEQSLPRSLSLENPYGQKS